MTLLVNLLLIALIAGYSFVVIKHYIHKSKQGKCSACQSNQSCPTNTLPKHLQ